MRLIDADPLREGLFESSQFDTYNDYSMMLDTIDLAPTIEAEPVKHGRWIKCTGDSRLICSVCKCKEHVPTINGKPIVWVCCPNCGTRMDEEDTNYDEYETAVEMEQYCERYESTYNSEDGSM